MRLKQYLLLQMHMEGELESAKVGAMDGEQVGAVSRGQGSRKQLRAVGRSRGRSRAATAAWCHRGKTARSPGGRQGSVPQ
jgi:hypothetical protein